MTASADVYDEKKILDDQRRPAVGGSEMGGSGTKVVREGNSEVAPQETPDMHSVAHSTPLFDDQQVRRFQELFQQAPWLYPQQFSPQMYPNQPVVMPGPQQFAPPLRRPLFLEQEEQRMDGGQCGGGLDPRLGYGSFGVELDRVLEENQKLKERLQALESLKKEDDPKFATPDGSENPKEKSNLAQPHDGAEEGQPSQTVARVTPRTSHVEDEQKPTTTAADLGAQEQGTAFAVMLKLMEGMQALQRQVSSLLKHRSTHGA